MKGTNNANECSAQTCKMANRSVKDALDVLHGSWKLSILASLSGGQKRFKEIARDVTGISDKMLSKELKDLEINQLVTRTAQDSFPPTVAYAATEYAASLQEVMEALSKWGIAHRQKIIGK